MATGKLWGFAATALALLMLLTGCAGADEGATAAAAPAAPGWQETGVASGLARTESVAAMPGADGASGNAIPVASFPKSDAAAAIPTPAPRAMAAATDDGSNHAAAGNAAGRETGQATARQIISTAELTIAAESVERAVSRARSIAADLGGFVEQLSSAGGAEPPRADLTLRVPQPQFFPALERLESLGEVQFRTLGQEDVTAQHIDLSARLNSAMREEQSLLALLERSGSVAEILAVERELARVRAEVERWQGQRNFLERRVELASIRLTLLPPGLGPSDPPRASFTLEVSNVADRVTQLKDYVAQREGALDEVYWLTYADGEQANVTFRVYAADFAGATAFVENQGRVRHKELREGVHQPGSQSAADTPRPKQPDSRLMVSYVDPDFALQPWLIGGLLSGIAVLAGGAALALRLAYRRGRIRGRFF